MAVSKVVFEPRNRCLFAGITDLLFSLIYILNCDSNGPIELDLVCTRLLNSSI